MGKRRHDGRIIVALVILGNIVIVEFLGHVVVEFGNIVIVRNVVCHLVKPNVIFFGNVEQFGNVVKFGHVLGHVVILVVRHVFLNVFGNVVKFIGRSG